MSVGVRPSRPIRAGRAAMIGLLACTGCRAALVIPIELESGNPVAEARINGMSTRLIVDSGGGMVALKPAAIERVAAARTGVLGNSTDALGNTGKQALLTLESLEIGGESFRNVAGVEGSAYAADSPGDGSIGREFLSRFVAIYDYRARRITLYDFDESAAARRECRGTSVRLLSDPEGIVVTRAMAGRNAMRVLWDTGAQHSFVKRSFAGDRKLIVEDPFYTAPTFKLGQHEFGPLRFVVLDIAAPANVDGFVGYNFFVDHVVCIDPFRRTVRIRKN
jgi:hypothetical protein